MLQESSIAISQGNDDANGIDESNHEPLITFQEVRLHIESTASYLRGRITMDTLRPLPMFLGITGPSFCFSPEAFNPPSKHMDKTAPEKLRARLSLNFAFFLTNYALISFGVLIVVALTHPKMLIHLGCIWGLWCLHLLALSNDSLLVIYNYDLGKILPASRRMLLLNALTVIVIVFECLMPFLSAIAISGFIIFFHAFMRDPKHVEKSGSFHRRVDSYDEANDTDEEVLVERADAVQ